MRYTVVIEKAEGNYSAYVPDLPECGKQAPAIPVKVSGEMNCRQQTCIEATFKKEYHFS